MRVRTGWLLTVLALLIIGIVWVDAEPLGSSTPVVQSAPLVTRPISTTPPFWNSDAFWLGVVLALVLMTMFVYLRDVVFYGEGR